MVRMAISLNLASCRCGKRPIFTRGKRLLIDYFIGYFFKILNSSLVTAVGSLQIKLVIYAMPKVPKWTHFSLFFASSREEIA